MSTAGTAALAVARETARTDSETVTKEETGTGTGAAQWTDILAKLVPVGMIAGYSVLLMILIGAIEDPTTEKPKPNEYIPGRIILWGIFIVLTFAYSWVAYQSRIGTRKNSNRMFPWELVASTFAFAAWGASTPGNFIEASSDSTLNKQIIPIGIAVISVLILGLFSTGIREKLPPPPQPPADP